MKELAAFSEMAKAMASKPSPRALQDAAQRGMEIVGNERCCVIMLTRKGGLKLVAGYPPEKHGIGEDIAHERSISLLTEIMKTRMDPLIIKNPAYDQRTSHLKELIEQHSITAIVYVPLRSKEEMLGVMVFDFTSEIKKPAEEIKRITKTIGDFVSFSIAHSRERQKEEVRIVRIDRLRALMEHSRNIAHETRNIFIAVGGHANHLHSKAKLHEDDKDHARIIYEMTRRAEGMFDNVLAFVNYSSQDLQMENHSINEFLKNTIKEASGLCKNARIQLRNGTHDTALYFDKEELCKCFFNIILNADQAGAHNIWMRHEVRSKTKSLLITVTNDGKAIDEGDLKNIFDPFFTTKKGGSGAGLSLSKAIIEEGHGGKITAENRICKSTKMNRTIFKIYLPL